MSNKKVFTNSQVEDIINLYTNEKISMSKIGEKYDCTKNVIRRVLTENNIEIKKDNHKYYADYGKFEIIDTPEKAYWLGFIAADGCNYQRKGNATVVINISQKDISHLEKFKKFMNSNVNIHKFTQSAGFCNKEHPSEMCKISFNSVKMSNDLADKGIVPRKSLILEPPKIDEQYYLPFILGYFDGDGSIYLGTTGTEYYINIVGTKEVLQWINQTMGTNQKLEQRYKTDKNTYYIRCGGINKPYNFMKKLYDSCPVHLDRKYEIFCSLETVVLSRNTE